MSTAFTLGQRFYDHGNANGDPDLGGHTTDGGRVQGFTRARYAECDRYACSPVVVLNPDDDDTIVALERAFAAHLDWLNSEGAVTQRRAAMQSALRSMLPTPKPPEPTSKWSVVEDREGVQWLRTEDYKDGDETVWLKDGWFSTSEWTHYRDIAAVKIIRDGVA